MKIEAGKYYVTRGGDVVGPMKRTDFDDWVWSGKDNYGVDYYLSNGRCFRGGSDPRDLIKEHVMPKFKVGDRVRYAAGGGDGEVIENHAWGHGRVTVKLDGGGRVNASNDLFSMISSPSLDLTKPVQTRDGRKVRLLCTDGPKGRPLVGLVGDEEFPISWRSDGTYYAVALESIYDLINTPAAPRTFERWFNVYECGVSVGWHSQMSADRADEDSRRDRLRDGDRIARKRVVFTEGEWDE